MKTIQWNCLVKTGFTGNSTIEVSKYPTTINSWASDNRRLRHEFHIEYVTTLHENC